MVPDLGRQEASDPAIVTQQSVACVPVPFDTSAAAAF